MARIRTIKRGSTKKRKIYQAELDTLIGYENNIARIKRARCALARSVMERLDRGVEIENGPHDADKWADGVFIRKLKVR